MTSIQAFLTLRVWHDDEGDLWQSHKCVDGTIESRLPSPWKADREGLVTPSINCTRCGLHEFGRVTAAPEGEKEGT